MHHVSEKDFKRNKEVANAPGLALCYWWIRLCSADIKIKNSCLTDVPQVVVVMKSLSLRLLLPPRFLNIAKYNNECSCSAHEDAKTIKVYYLRSWIQLSFTDLRELRVFGVKSEVHRAGARVLGSKYQTWSKPY
jgi:hypothetical protein